MDRYEEALGRARHGLPIDEVFPELKESEDERIRKEMIEAISKIEPGKTYIRLSQEEKEAWIAYLEKLKEQKYYTYEQSKQAAEDCYYDKGYNTEDDGRCNEQSFLWGFEEGVDWCEQQKERKPVDLSEMMVHKEPYIAPVPIPIVADEQQPVEWSAYDKATIEYIIEDIKELRDEETDEEVIETYGRELNLLQCINDSVKLCNYTNPAEWSEEEMRKIVELKYFITQCNGFNKENRKKAFDMIDAFRPRPHWKPSEEQMKALEHFIRSWGESGTMSPQNTILCAAKSLLSDLQKLL